MDPVESFRLEAQAFLDSAPHEDSAEFDDWDPFAAVDLLRRAVALLTPPVQKVPVDDILSLYHNRLPTLPKVLRLNEVRRRAIAARWNECAAQRSLEFWAGYFAKVAESDFLTGRTSTWSATFDWLMKPANMTKVIEGNYRNKAEVSRGAAAANQLFDSVKLEQDRRLNGGSK